MGTEAFGNWLQNRMNQNAVDQQNVYNLPKNQVQRLLDAGLSPGLMYHGGGSTGLQPAPVQYTAPNLNPIHHMAKFAAAENLFRKGDVMAHQAGYLSEKIKQSAAQTISERLRHPALEAAVQRARAEVPYYPELARFNVGQAQESLDQMIKKTRLIESQLTNLERDRLIKDEILKSKTNDNFRRLFGVEAKDPWYYRGAAAGAKHLYDFYQGHFNRKNK